MADIPIATSDTPRSEDPEAILAEVEKGLAASGATKIEAARQLGATTGRLTRDILVPMAGPALWAGAMVGIGRALAAAADAPADLVELGQAEGLGPLDDQRVGLRDVDARLDDRRAQQHVEALLVEVEHHAFEFALVQLAVADDDGYLLTGGKVWVANAEAAESVHATATQVTAISERAVAV